MMGGIKETVTDLATKFADLYKEFVTNTVQFQELRQYTKETLDQFKHLLERLSDKLEASEKDRIRRETELLSKINALEAKLDALSQQALHAAAKEAAIQTFERMVAGKRSGDFPGQVQEEAKQLSDGTTNS